MSRTIPRIALVSALAAAIVLAGCAEAPPAGPAAPNLQPALEGQRLAGVCPDPVVIQTQWEPEADLGVMYQLVGPGYTVDAERKRIRGPLVVDGADTGVEVEVRPGGAAIGFAAVPAQMYLDPEITLGVVHTDLAVSTSAAQPTTAVMAPTTKNPFVLLWDPASHPDWRTVADIGASGARVVVAKDQIFPWLLIAKGLLKPEQVDPGFTGSPSRFVADPTIAQQAVVTEQPYTYRHELAAWGKPVRYQMLADVGYDVYYASITVRTPDLERLSACLSRLVPVLQRAQLAYYHDPAPTNRLIVDLVRQYDDGWVYTDGMANYGAAKMQELGLIANDASGPLGGIHLPRVQSVIDTLTPLLVRRGDSVRPDLKASDIATDRFLDPTIKIN